MSFEGAQTALVGVSASADLSAKQFYAMKISGVKTVTVCAAVTDKVCGILQDAPTSGQPANVAVAGVSKAVAGSGGVTAGDTVGAASDGTLVTYVEGTDTTKYRVGRALETAAAGAIFAVQLMLGGRLA